MLIGNPESGLRGWLIPSPLTGPAFAPILLPVAWIKVHGKTRDWGATSLARWQLGAVGQPRHAIPVALGYTSSPVAFRPQASGAGRAAKGGGGSSKPPDF